MTSTALKRFVVDGNANGHERRLTVLRTCTWNLPYSEPPQKLAKKAKSLLYHIEINFEKQVRTCDAFEQDTKDYDEENQRMVLDDLILQKKSELLSLQSKWREINIEKINQERREALAHVINGLPSKEESKSVIAEIQNQQNELANREKMINDKMEARKELLFPLGINLAMVMAEFKDDIETRQKRLQEQKANQKDSKSENDKESSEPVS